MKKQHLTLALLAAFTLLAAASCARKNTCPAYGQTHLQMPVR